MRMSSLISVDLGTMGSETSTDESDIIKRCRKLWKSTDSRGELFKCKFYLPQKLQSPTVLSLTIKSQVVGVE